MKFGVIDGCPVPEEIYPAVLALKKASGQTLLSCYRGSDPAGVAILHRNGKSNQAELYAGYVAGRPGYNPANPPGQSTHECRSDGVPYAGPRGRPLAGWQCGMDWGPDSGKVMEAANKLGIKLIRPYTAGSEYHHLNFYRAPKIRLTPTLKKGSKGPYVFALIRRLKYLGYLPRKATHPRFTYDGKVVIAVRQFQRDHKLTVDGVVGPHTNANILASVRWRKQHPKVHKPAHKPTPKPPVHKPTPKPAKKPTVKPPARQKGVDVSEGNGDINFAKVKAAGYTFAFTRATWGDSDSDDRFSKARVDAVRKAGLRWGAYHYAYPASSSDAKVEARNFVRTVKAAGGWKRGDFLPVLDIEESKLGAADTLKWCHAFVAEVRNLTGLGCIIYTGFYWRDAMGNPANNLGCPLWLAAYVASPGQYVPRAWTKEGYSIWQHSETGHVPGVPGACDLDQLLTSRLPRLTVK